MCGIRAGGGAMRGERIAVGEERGGRVGRWLGNEGQIRRAISSGVKIYY